ncbi:MAG: TPM domain-containing protein [Steroidobacteraceae bacterium]
MLPSQAEIDALDLQIARVHAATGVRVVAAEIGKADTYEELPWKAFALGASFAALAMAGTDALCPRCATQHLTVLSAAIALAAGALAALFTIYVPAFGRLFLHAAKCELEVGQYAQALFLRRELFDTPHRDAVLILVSRFERRVHILPDTGLRNAVGQAAWQVVIERMKPALRQSRTADALQAGIAAVEELLVRTGYQGGAGSGPSDPLIVEKGA